MNLLSFVSVLVMSMNAAAFAATTPIDVWGKKIEVPVEVLLAPVKGYDSNDNVEVVLHGYLPNTCYRLDSYQADREPSTGNFRIRQFAVKKNDGVCGEDSAMPEHLNMLVPFTTVASLGALPAGQYNLKYSLGKENTGARVLNIAAASRPSVDDYSYAAVSSAITTDAITRKDNISVTLSGVLTSGCSYLDGNNIKVQKSEDVYIVLPVLGFRSDLLCIQSLVPFTKTLDLGTRDKLGHFLVHVRSMNGSSINRVISVVQ